LKEFKDFPEKADNKKSGRVSVLQRKYFLKILLSICRKTDICFRQKMWWDRNSSAERRIS